MLGRVVQEAGYGCVRCGSHEDANILTQAVHDLRCWGVRTAVINVWIRLSAPHWFKEA